MTCEPACLSMCKLLDGIEHTDRDEVSVQHVLDLVAWGETNEGLGRGLRLNLSLACKLLLNF